MHTQRQQFERQQFDGMSSQQQGGSFVHWWVCFAAVGVLLASPLTTFAQAPDPQQAAEEEAKEKEAEEKRKPPLEIGRLVPRFGEQAIDGEADGPTFAIKPGHWTAAVQSMQANYNDFVGQFSAEVVDDSRQPVPLDHSRFGLKIIRGVTLAKGKERQIETELFLPQHSTGTRLEARLTDRDSGSEVYQFQPKITPIPAYQYNLVVLATEPDKYAFLKVTNTVRAPWEEEFEESSQVHYQVALLRAGMQIPLPENPLAWTSIAYIVWDEADPTQFTSAQQEALLDWLHWGGRLIVNGPDSLAMLKGSFLDPYLPAEDGGPREITANELAAWSAYWGERENGQEIPPLAPSKPFSGIQLLVRTGSSELVGGGGLFYTRDVGRGLITVSALQLAERECLDWRGFDGFLNAGLLQRPRRMFSTGPYGGEQVDWAGLNQRRLDAHFTTPLRLFARDAQAAANTRRVNNSAPNAMGMPQEISELEVDRPGGVAAWDEFSPVAQVVRELLLLAAGVQVPGAGFVLGCLAFYLLVLVPVNWLVFRTIERVEWAWIAVPFIAILGTWVVVKQAQLDIGFVRSQTEVAILEIYGGHDRGLLSRFTAMYSSLSTTYEIKFPDQQSAAVLPFPASGDDPTDWQQSVVFDESSSPRLEGLTVSSSATRLVHAEQVVQLEGPLRLGKSSRGLEQVENRTQHNLRDVAVVRRTYDDAGKPRYEGSWLGDLRRGNSAVLGLRSFAWDPKQLPFAPERETAARGRAISTIHVDALLQLAFNMEDKHDPVGKRDETRLVGVIDAALPGMEIEPTASQHQGATVVIAHLAYGPLATPRPDANSPADVLSPAQNNESP